VIRISFTLTVPLALAFAFAYPPLVVAESKPVANFTLTDTAGKPWPMHDQNAKAIVVVFLACDCPMSNGYLPALADLAAKSADKGVLVVGIHADPDETAEQVRKHAAEFKLGFPMLRDPDHAAVTALGVKTTPEVVLLDEKRFVRYRGRIDDGYVGRAKPRATVTRHDLSEALDELLSGKPVSVPETKPFGCPIPDLAPKKQAGESAVTFYKDVRPVLQAHCQACHRPGQVAPFALVTYKDAAKWAETALEEVKAKRMPPWKAEKNPLLGDGRLLPETAATTLEKWVAQGMAEGNPKDAPPAPKFTDGWALGEPDLILEAPRDMVVDGSGPDLFRVVVMPTGLTEDKYVVALEVKPGNPRVVHHTLLLADPNGIARKKEAEFQTKETPGGKDHGPGYSVGMGWGFSPSPAMVLGGWAPGLIPTRLPEGVAQKLPKGSDLCIQIHFHRTGKVERERTKVGLYFAKAPPAECFRSMPVAGLFTRIPPGNSNYKVESSWELTADATVYRVTPHMHLLGKEIELTAKPPGGKELLLIRVPDWDYNWQEQYMLKKPLPFPKGTLLRVRATYDNSADNPRNPFSPPQPVRIGEQTTNEMCFVFLGLSSMSTARYIVSPILLK
jgi:peroxiredoxin